MIRSTEAVGTGETAFAKSYRRDRSRHSPPSLSASGAVRIAFARARLRQVDNKRWSGDARQGALRRAVVRAPQ